MLYFKINAKFQVVAIEASLPEECKANPAAWARDAQGNFGAGWLNRNDISANPAPRMFAQVLATSASEFAGKAYIMVDQGEGCSPRFDVIEAPAVGEEVSMAFNGDYYPVGKVIKIGKDFKQVKVDGPRGVKVFYRKKESAAWLANGMWSLVPGTIERWNPEF